MTKTLIKVKKKTTRKLKSAHLDQIIQCELPKFEVIPYEYYTENKYGEFYYRKDCTFFYISRE